MYISLALVLALISPMCAYFFQRGQMDIMTHNDSSYAKHNNLYLRVGIGTALFSLVGFVLGSCLALSIFEASS